MVILSPIGRIGAPFVGALLGAAITFEIGPNLGTVITALVNAVAAALISHALRKRATTALALNDSRAKRRKKHRSHSTPENNQGNQP